jgi:hypothetical protein
MKEQRGPTAVSALVAPVWREGAVEVAALMGHSIREHAVRQVEAK